MSPRDENILDAARDLAEDLKDKPSLDAAVDTLAEYDDKLSRKFRRLCLLVNGAPKKAH